MKVNETYQDETGRLFRIEKINPQTVVIKEVGGLRLVNRWLLEIDIEEKQVKLKGTGKGK